MKLETQLVNPEEFGIEKAKANELVGNLPQILNERKALEQQFDEVIKLDITDAENQKRARELRLLIQKNRTQGINVWHRTTKEFFLKGGQFVDAIKKKEVVVNERMEADLEQIEKYAQIQEERRIAKLQEERAKMLDPFVDDAHLRQLGTMEDDVWEAYFAAKKQAYEAEQEAIRQQEEARKERERKVALMMKRERDVRELSEWFSFEKLGIDTTEEEYKALVEQATNAKKEYFDEVERIKKEAEQKAKELQLERQKAEAERKKAEAERKKQDAERAAKERELEAAREAARKAELARIEAEKKEAERIAEEKRKQEEQERLHREAKEKAEQDAREAAAAPVRKRLVAWVDTFSIPELPGDSNEVSDNIEAKFDAFKNWAKKQVKSIK